MHLAVAPESAIDAAFVTHTPEFRLAAFPRRALQLVGAVVAVHVPVAHPPRGDTLIILTPKVTRVARMEQRVITVFVLVFVFAAVRVAVAAPCFRYAAAGFAPEIIIRALASRAVV